MTAVGFDTETWLIEPGSAAPPLVCETSATEEGEARLFHAKTSCMPYGHIGPPIDHKTAEEHFRWVLQQDPVFGLHIAYDMGVCLAQWPSTAKAIFDAYDDDRIIDVGLCQQLIDNASGKAKELMGKGYSLAALVRRHFDIDREKAKKEPDSWRLRYRSLYDVPLPKWPEAAVEYPLDDARDPLRLGLYLLEAHEALLKDAPAQSRAALALQLLTCWGVMVDEERVLRLQEEAKKLYVVLTKELVDKGLVRPAYAEKSPGTRDMRAAQRRMILWCKMYDLPLKLTDKGIEELKKRRGEDKKSPLPEPEVAFPEDELVQYVSVDEDACKETGDSVLIAYSRRTQVHGILYTHVPDLLKGVKKPIQPRYSPMVDSGRTSCSKGKGGALNGFQFQNPKKSLDYFPPGTGIRECFIARPGRLFADPDFSQLELHTGAQACIAAVGYSRLAEALNAGRDAHLQFGAKLMGISYEEAKARKHEKVVKFHRNLAKIFLFGRPGGLGMRGMVGYARGYGVKMSLEDAKRYDREWLEEFPEWADYFKFVRKHIDVTNGEGTIAQLYVGRIRGGVIFTSACNCLDDETEALTQRGWVKGFDLVPGEKLLVKNAETGKMEWQIASRICLYPNYEGPLVEFKTKSFSAVTTPNHRWLVNSKKGKVLCKTTEEIGKNGDFRIHRAGLYEGPSVSAYTDDFVELAGWVLTDGSLPENRKCLTVYQSQRANPEKVDKINKLFSRMDLKPNVWGPKENGAVRWTLGSKCNLVHLFKELFPRRVLSSEFLHQLTKRQLELLWKTMMLGDGTCKGRPYLERTKGHQQHFRARSKEVADAFQHLCTLVGFASKSYWRDLSMYTPKISSKILNSPKGKGAWMVEILKRDTVQVVNLNRVYGKSKVQTQQRREYVGRARMWCPVVKHTYFVARRNGTVYITGNTLFQGLGADGAKHALYEVSKRCYVPEMQSVLYGARPVGFIHDEILAEVFEEFAHEQAVEMARVMAEACNKFLLDVPVRCQPTLCKRWSKDVEPVYERGGRLLPYDLARERKQEAFYDASCTERVDWQKLEEEAIDRWKKAVMV